MSIGNNVSDFWATFWHLHPISHLNENGSVKTMQQYSQEYEAEMKGKLFDEHVELIAKSNQGSLFVKIMNKIGKIASLKYTADNFAQDFGGKVLISPVDHYNKDGSLKTAAQYEADLRNEKANSCVYHQTLIEYDNSNYFELSCNTFGQMVSNMFNGKAFTALMSGAKLVGYSAGFLLHDVAYNVSNQSYELLKSGLNININTVNGLDQGVFSIKDSVYKSELSHPGPDLPLFSMQHNSSLESHESLLGNNEEMILSGVHSFIDFTIAS
jgi:hypothetical protein